jgi:hypothetical protein
MFPAGQYILIYVVVTFADVHGTPQGDLHLLKQGWVSFGTKSYSHTKIHYFYTYNKL